MPIFLTFASPKRNIYFYMTSTEIRSTFLEFFKSKQHLIVPSAPMVVKDDPTLMFTNAGMNQFKDIFLGNSNASSGRIADTQKCLRVSGKHNDLEEVGHDTYHHTMFEMLGNWSFGDYFKKEAIEWAWELLTKVYGIPEEKLYVTVFEGDKTDGLTADNEASSFWKTWIPEERILLGSKKDNFWEMGDTGPCGPCSEIHVDLRDEDDRATVPGKELVNKGHHLVIEIWNLVFIEFNRKADGSLEKLPSRHVDTGMGFERLCMTLQHKKSNYDTDVFQPLIQFIAGLSSIPYGTSIKQDIAMRVIADHIRAIAFAIADGQLPSNNKAGYVIRRILRRAVRYGFTFLNLKEPFLNLLVEPLTSQMGEQFPELKTQKELVKKVIAEEELSFLKTLDTGIHLLEQVVKQNQGTGNTIIPGRTVFELYDTFGFPVDLTELMLREHGLTADMKSFELAMQEQKSRSRNAAVTEAGDWVMLREAEQTRFVGYDNIRADANILRYRSVSAKDKTFYHLVLDQTPFYAESGGQVGDSGSLTFGSEIIHVTDTKRENNLIIHICDRLPVNPMETALAEVNSVKREATARNHSATHLMHHALRKILGTHVEQKGSLVHPDYLRFDFSHFQKMSKEEIQAVEKMVNELVLKNLNLNEFRNVPVEEAKKSGALMLFGEKYGDSVRMIKFGDSVELCGGTHVTGTGSIGLFKIISESAIAAGVRRIEAITGTAVTEYYEGFVQMVDQFKLITKNPVDPLKGLKNIIEQNEKLQEEIDSLRKEQVNALKQELKSKLIQSNGIWFLSSLVPVDAYGAKEIAFALKEEFTDLVLVLGYNVDNKPGLSVLVSDTLIASRGLNAAEIVKALAHNILGGGGGQAGFATAGGKNADGLIKALQEAEKLLS